MNIIYKNNSILMRVHHLNNIQAIDCVELNEEEFTAAYKEAHDANIITHVGEHGFTIKNCNYSFHLVTG